MTKETIEEIRVEVTSNGDVALYLMIHRDGSLGRHGSGAVPRTQTAALGMTDGRYFREIMEMVDEVVFSHAGEYDYPDKSGVQVEYSLAFLWPKTAKPDRPMVGFRLSLGTATANVHPIVKYVDTFVTRAVSATELWYQAALAGKRGSECPGGL